MKRRRFLTTLGLGALAARFGRLPEAAAPAPVWQHETLRSGFTLSGQKLLRKMPPGTIFAIDRDAAGRGGAR